VQYFDDIRVGDTKESAGDYELTAEEIIAFCSTWDPLPFHVDEKVAAQTPVGKLFTSAVHSVAIAIRLGHQMQKEPTSTVMGLGWDEVRFQTPACAGDRLRVRGEVIEVRPSESKPGFGIVRSLLRLTNQRGETVISFKAAALLRRRPQDG
jgi:acyl dehydratase